MREEDGHREDLKSGVIGLAVALVGLFAVMAVAHLMAL